MGPRKKQGRDVIGPIPPVRPIRLIDPSSRLELAGPSALIDRPVVGLDNKRPVEV
jgi:hypothetical protein